jgi:hypothetical protein
MHVTCSIPLGCPLPLTVPTANHVATLKAPDVGHRFMQRRLSASMMVGRMSPANAQ